MELCHHKYVKLQLIRILSRYNGGRKKLLDIGCNTGALAHDFAQLRFGVIGIDISKRKR